MIQGTADLEKKLEKIKDEKFKSEMALSECLRQLQISKSWLTEASIKLVEIQAQLEFANDVKQATEEEIKDVNAKRELAESKLRIAEENSESFRNWRMSFRKLNMRLIFGSKTRSGVLLALMDS